MAITVTAKDREDVFNGNAPYSTPFQESSNRTTGVKQVNGCLANPAFVADLKIKAFTIPSGYSTLYDFQWGDIDCLSAIYETLVAKQDSYFGKKVNNTPSAAVLNYMLMLCCIEIGGLSDALNIRDKEMGERKSVTYTFVKGIIEEVKTGTPSKTILETCKELLETNFNIILSGAPGTGKTYLAKQIARAMTGSDDRVGFVQFHPSYDYTDFVEGLRPTPPYGSTIGFERMDGIFKEFCEKALSASVTSVVTSSSPLSVDDAYKSLADDINNHTVSSLPLKTGKSMDAIVSVDNIILSTHGGGKSYTVTLDDISKLSKKYPDKASLNGMKNINDEIRSVLGGRHSSSIWAVLYEIYNRMELGITAASKKQKYIFIIDEINRGEISKVFGELFFSIDPGYRGSDGKVRTQYANMVSVPNAFDKVLGVTGPKECGHFFVPENVYIIGTMNDIDRSVDTMDFAMRRRFLIKEIKAEDTQSAMLERMDVIKKINGSVTKIEPKVIAKMDALNVVIEGKSDRKTRAKLGSAYALGASYFQKYYKYNDFDKLWTNHIEGILREYLRGTADPDNDLKLLKETYYNA